MSNWITDAQKEAGKIKLQKESEESSRKNGIRLERQRKEIEFRNLFHRVNNGVIKEIEKVMQKARSQGLVVTGPDEGVYSSGVGDLLVYTCAVDGPTYWDGTEYTYHIYTMYWSLKYPGKNEILNIGLGVRINENNLFFKYTPTTNGKDVEIKIKNWLVQIFSEQK